jgi:hypothetical protein
MESDKRMLREYWNLIGVGSNIKAKKLHSDEFHNLYSLPDVIMVVYLRIKSWVWQE